jgi:hypothetical protein
VFKIGIIRNGPIIWKPPKLDFYDAERQLTDTQQITQRVLPADWIQSDRGSLSEYNTTNTFDWVVNAGFNSDVVATITFLTKQKVKYIDWCIWRIRTNDVPAFGDFEYVYVELSIRKVAGSGTLFVVNDVMTGGGNPSSHTPFCMSGRVWMYDYVVEPNMVLEVKLVGQITVTTTIIRGLVNANSIKFL